MKYPSKKVTNFLSNVWFRNPSYGPYLTQKVFTIDNTNSRKYSTDTNTIIIFRRIVKEFII